MSHVVDMPDVLAEIDHFRAKLADHFITFDPAMSTKSSSSNEPSPRPATGHEFLDVALARRISSCGWPRSRD